MEKESNLDFITLGKGICNNCIHSLPSKRGQSYPSCEAFPDGIPEDILTGRILHLYPVDGDNDIQFEKVIVE